MISLGIESTAHTFGVGITDGESIIANEKACYSSKEGIHPRKASQHHNKKAPDVLERALEKEKEIDLISFSRGPGLGPCLRIGATLAKTISLYLQKPLVGVNHCVAHIDAGKWDTGFEKPLTLFVSGANTQILGLKGKKYRIYGETLDMGVGNAIDSFARKMGLGFPGVPKVEELAEGGEYVDLPYTVKGTDLAFSGLVTAAEQKTKEESKKDVAYSFLENIYGMVCEATERALAHTKKKELMVVGGVGRSNIFKEKLETVCEEQGAELKVPRKKINGDNGLMIALTGMKKFKSQGEDEKSIQTIQSWRTNEVKIDW